MKPLLLATFILAASHASAQKIQKFYDWQWNETDLPHARFLSITEHTDSGWHRQDFYLSSNSLQMEGTCEDSACKIHNGKFVFAYPDKKLESTGRYAHGKRQGLWLTLHPDGTLADSTVYEAGNPVGTRLSWYRNGMPADSAFYNPDGSGVNVGWFDNGQPSFGGLYAAGYKKNGRWRYYHKNGRLSSIEGYDHGNLTEKQYFNEEGQALTDTTTKDHNAVFRGGSQDWVKYLDGHLHWPSDYTIVNSDQVTVVVSFTIDEDGKVIDAYISMPFHPSFDKIALNTILHSPAWKPAFQHNRRVRYQARQPVIFSQPE